VWVIGLAIAHSFLVQKFPKDDMLIYWLFPGILMYICDLWIRFSRGAVPTELISMQRDVGGEVVHVQLRRKNFQFEPGQYVYINFPEVSKFEWHPFSIATSPSDVRMTPGSSIFSLAMKDMGPRSWSRRVVSMSCASVFQRDVKVRVDGPYGGPSIDIYDYPILVLVAGGIGVTPLFSILSEFSNNPPLKLEKIYLIWCTKHQHFLTLFSEYLANMDSFFGKIEMQHYVTQPDSQSMQRIINDPGIAMASAASDANSSSKNMAFNLGRPDFNEFFSEVSRAHFDQRIGVSVCGPPTMIQDVKNACYKYNKKHKRSIDVHSELFYL